MTIGHFTFICLNALHSTLTYCSSCGFIMNFVLFFILFFTVTFSLPVDDKEDETSLPPPLTHLPPIIHPIVDCHGSCPSGWFRYQKSCYLYNRERAQAVAAQIFCSNHNATLVSFDDLQEMNAIQTHMTLARWTWIGLDVRPFESRGNSPVWVVEPGMDIELLPWLNKLSGHGHTSTTNCVSYYKPDAAGGHYIHFYPCTYLHYFVCEKPVR